MKYKAGRAIFVTIVILLFAGCKGGGDSDTPPDTPPLETIVSEDAVILTEQEGASVTAFDSTSGQITLSTDLQKNEDISEGGFIVSGVIDSAPHGFLRKVIKKSVSGNNLVLETEQASLTDVIVQGSVSFSGSLTESILNPITPSKHSLKSFANKGYPSGIIKVYEREGVHLVNGTHNPYSGLSKSRSTQTSSEIEIDPNEFVLVEMDTEIVDGVHLRGTTGFSADYEIDSAISSFELEMFKTMITGTLKQYVSLEATKDIALEKETLLATYILPVVAFAIGPVPVVLVPKINLFAGVDGKVTYGLQASANSDITTSFGVEYINSEWEQIEARDITFNYQPPEFLANMEVNTYAGPRFELLFYGISGVVANVDGYITAQVDLLSNPWWELYGGIRAGIGVVVDLFSKRIVDISYPDLMEYQTLIAQSPPGEMSLLPGRWEGVYSWTCGGGGSKNISVNFTQDGSDIAGEISYPDDFFYISGSRGDALHIDYPSGSDFPAGIKELSASGPYIHFYQLDYSGILNAFAGEITGNTIKGITLNGEGCSVDSTHSGTFQLTKQ